MSGTLRKKLYFFSDFYPCSTGTKLAYEITLNGMVKGSIQSLPLQFRTLSVLA